MMRKSRFVRPDVVTLPLPPNLDGTVDTITVKKRLNAGELRAQIAKSYRPDGPEGTMVYSRLHSGLALVAAYLVDWSLTDDEGERVPIRGLSYDDMVRTVDSLDPDDFTELKTVVEAHEAAMDKERAQEKKLPGGPTTASATLPLPSELVGASTGSAT